MIDFNKLSKDISKKRNKITKNLKEIEKNNHSIDLKSKSIKLESVLNSFPSKGTRSINFHNLLNEKYDFYDTSQFNKISRFVVFVENIEKDYYSLVKKSKKDYITNPNSEVFGNLITKFNFLSLNYQLLKILTNEVDGDKLMFNKVFNELEDQGMFLTKVEIFNIETYKSINKSLGSVVNLLDSINNNMDELSMEVSMSNHTLSDISSTLWDIELNTKTK